MRYFNGIQEEKNMKSVTKDDKKKWIGVRKSHTEPNFVIFSVPEGIGTLEAELWCWWCW
jgi:hypothetical protein